MKADPDVVAALNAVYVLVLTLKEQTHLQEHVFQAAHYRRLLKKFDKLTNAIHATWIHWLVMWFTAHGELPDSELADFQVADADDPGDAFSYSGDLLKSLEQALLTACVAVHAADDYVTGKLVHCLLNKVEKLRDCFGAEADLVDTLGKQLYLQGQINTPFYRKKKKK